MNSDRRTMVQQKQTDQKRNNKKLRKSSKTLKQKDAKPNEESD